MKKQAISVTEAARNFADCVNRVRYQGMTFVLLKNGEAVARLIPEKKKAGSVRKLAAALREFDLSPEESRSWRRDLHAARRTLKPPADKWKE
jgi:antitoxin (DNA-binding transcriptional repressor) of toxin-antitoxin stability system